MDTRDRFGALVEVLGSRPGVLPPEESRSGRAFGSTALTVEGRIFAMAVGGALVLKLPKERVDALVAGGAGEPFVGGNGRPMREWVALAQGPGTEDVELAEEALAFVRSLRR